MESITAWISNNLHIIFLALFAQILISESSPLNKETRSENSVCAIGWLHFERFCVTRAKGESETAVALYCDGFGGIGVKGHCITKAHNMDDGSYGESNARSSSLRDALLRVAAGQEDDPMSDLVGVSEDGDQDIEETACQKGWKHYGKLCVYQPLSVKEECHRLNAVEFSGLCLKHADMAAVKRRGLKYSSSDREKRVCCCAHVSAKGNGYGCY